MSYQGSDAGVTVSLKDGTGGGGHAEGDVMINVENVVGSDYQDALTGDDSPNRLEGGDGNDSLWGNHGQDVLEGGAGADVLEGGADADVLEGGPGADRLEGGPGTDTAVYRNSNEAVTVNLDYGTTAGGHAAGDALVDIENIVGSVHDDRLTGAGGANRLEGGRGDDRLEGGAGADRLDGGTGSDWLYGNDGDDHLVGGTGSDVLYGNDGDDHLVGGDHGDVLDGGAGADRLDGGEGSDWVFYEGSDTGITVNLGDGTGQGGHAEGDIITDVGNVKGSAYRDILVGSDSANTLAGMGGDDVLTGGAGNDHLDGGEGKDIFIFAAGHGDDTIYPFTNDQDLIDLTAFGLSGFDELSAWTDGYNVTIYLSAHGGETIQILDFDIANLDASDFIF